MKLILASQSPRRRELLKKLTDDFSVLPAHGEEKADPSLPPEEFVRALAQAKAREVAALPQARGKIVLGADTVVVSPDREILGKPKDEKQAFEMLSALSGKIHEVFTGVCLILPSGEIRTAVDRTEVEFENLSPSFIKKYVESGSPMDKAGAYGIQDGGLVKRIEGSYDNVVGLPTELLKELLSDLL